MTTSSGRDRRWELLMTMGKRWGVMALVAVLVLGTMGAALASEDSTETDETKHAFDVDSYIGNYIWASTFAKIVVLSWAHDDACVEPEAETPSGFGFLLTPVPDEEVCTPRTLTGPHGQLNHGSMVSSVVHWLKEGNLDELADGFEDLPRGQLVKLFAHEDFGKGFDVREDLVESDDVVEAEDGDGHGPPQWVKDKKANKAAEKVAKGTNK